MDEGKRQEQSREGWFSVCLIVFTMAAILFGVALKTEYGKWFCIPTGAVGVILIASMACLLDPDVAEAELIVKRHKLRESAASKLTNEEKEEVGLD